MNVLPLYIFPSKKNGGHFSGSKALLFSVQKPNRSEAFFCDSMILRPVDGNLCPYVFTWSEVRYVLPEGKLGERFLRGPLATLPETNRISPENRPSPKKNPGGNHPFSEDTPPKV